ncbi:MAG: Undecaprenyl-phosphate mannosyltransferase [Paracidovorax wautersii]|uniref:Undecaprenyl-phosphate mannosyltransferase n=1 Tax=Paracidovorax wautersii TaxID=1177982 RepID=A0A7V8JRL7_9BURK|nr:MAG: Undecaprenyl-phosphate mannosyltransferase [Paracidovorax wautersii]
MHSLCAVIPVYNHKRAIAGVVAGLRDQLVPCILVDDGSDASCARALQALAHMPDVTLLTLACNGGKGGAVLAGLAEARRLGFSHALQVDADGQHDLSGLAAFAQTSRLAPQAVVCGHPRYDDSVPLGRKIGRYATHVWVWINTLSLDIRDSMCGFRIYPLATALALADTEPVGRRMDFDTEILVRMHWRGVPMAWLPVAVHYPADGISHFRLWRDNVRISCMHARLFAGMLRRLPGWAWRKLKRCARGER